MTLHMNRDPWPIGMPHEPYHGIIRQIAPHPAPLYTAGIGIIKGDSIGYTTYFTEPFRFGEAARYAEHMAIRAQDELRKFWSY